MSLVAFRRNADVRAGPEVRRFVSSNVKDLLFVTHTNPDGSQVVRSTREIDATPSSVCADLVAWAQRQPDAVFLAQRRDDAWETLDYRCALDRVRTIAASLLRSPASATAPLAIVAENSIEHALVALAAMYAGIPVAPLSLGYVTPASDPRRMQDLLEVLRPGLMFAGSEQVAQRLRIIAPDVPIVMGFENAALDVNEADEAFSRVDAGTIAKIMFTSGSTGAPKGVITTNGMLAANQTQTAMAWPELTAERPILVDWLPWSHVMGGSHNFGMVLRNGGTLYIDEGRPVGNAFATSIRNLRDVSPTLYFAVPRVFTLLLEAFEGDEAFTAAFFRRLRGLGNAAASLPQPVRDELIRLARTYAPHDVRVTSSWGMTETAPMSTTSWGERGPDDDTIGTPAPGVEIKLAPSDGLTEMRVKGPNVTPGYWRNTQATRAAFDGDGYFRTGDAASLKDPHDPSRGLVFAGRLAENFKLATGTWVNVGALRLALIERGAPLIEDVVLTGHDRDELGALVFVRAEAAAQIADVRAFVANALGAHNAASPGSSTRIVRAMIVPEPPDRAHGEITDKGSVNQRRSLQLRAHDVTLLDAGGDDPRIILPAS
jgi:feruloyl-CoA synthase